MRPGILTFLSLFLLVYARGRYALTGRLLYHVTSDISTSRDRARLLVCFPFPLT